MNTNNVTNMEDHINNRAVEIILLALILLVTNAMAQSNININVRTRTAPKHLKTADDIWDFIKPSKKTHAYFTVMGVKVNDTISLKVNDEIIFNNRIYNKKDSLMYADLNGMITLSFFLLLYSNYQLKAIYNSEDTSDYCAYRKIKSKDAKCEVEITFNGKIYSFLFDLTFQWHNILIGRDYRKVDYYCEKHFRGID